MIKICAVESCGLPIRCKGVCNAHYQRYRLYGRYDTAVWGQSSNPLHNLWSDRKRKNELCEEWLDFKTFLADVGNRPEGDFRMGRNDKSKPFGPGNFYWKEYYRVRDGETVKEKNQRRRSENPDIYKRSELLKTFGLSLEEYNSKLISQNYVCAICEQPEKTVHHITGKLKSLAVDHCHNSKDMKIRGLLCQRCNRVLGKVNDDKNLLLKMKEYLDGYG